MLILLKFRLPLQSQNHYAEASDFFMRHPQAEILLAWLKGHPGTFGFQEEGAGLHLVEIYSGKNRILRDVEIVRIEERPNTVNPNETYLVLLLEDGRQLALSPQGFAFAPDFINTGPLPLPNQVYCMQDFQDLFNKLKHLGSEDDRKAEALQLITVLISLVDGAKAVGLDLDREAEEVDKILVQLEKGTPLPPPHGS